MKKFLLIPLLALFTCVNMWADPVAIASFNGKTYYSGSGTDDATHVYKADDAAAFEAAVDDANTAQGGTVVVLNDVVTTAKTVKNSNPIQYKAEAITAGISNTSPDANKDNHIIIDGNNHTLNCYFDYLYGYDTLTLKDVTIKNENNGSWCVRMNQGSRLILNNAHLVGRSGQTALKVNASDPTQVVTIEAASGSTNVIENTDGSTTSNTLTGNSAMLVIEGEGTLTVKNTGTTSGYLFSGATGSTSTYCANFRLNAPNAVYTYEGEHNENPNATVTVIKNQGTYNVSVPSFMEAGKKVFPVSGYSQIKYALAEANDGDILRLNRISNETTITIGKQIVLDKSITFDFGVMTIESALPNVIQIGTSENSTNTVTFESSATGATIGGLNASSGMLSGGIIDVFGKLIINSGRFTRTYSSSSNIGSILSLEPGADVTINGGTFNGFKRVIYSTADASHATKLTINDGTFSAKYTNKTGQSSILDIRGKVGDGEAYSNTVTINGGSFSGGWAGAELWGKGAVLNVTGGSLDGLAYAIAGNGSAEYGGTKIKISGGTVGSETTQAAIYHPQNGQLVISGNPVIKGLTGIQMCAGTGMTGSITGGRIEAVADEWDGDKQGDGLIPDGCALSIVERDGYTGAPSFAVNGGNFLSKHNSALIAYKWANDTRSVWEESANYLQVTEGNFSSDPTGFVGTTGYSITTNTAQPFGEDYPTIWVVAQEFVTTNDFTNESDIEYVQLVANQTLTEEEQSAKYVEITGSNTLTVSSNTTLNIGSGGLTMSGEESTLIIKPNAVVTVGSNGINNNFDADNLIIEANGNEEAGILLVDPDALNGTQPLATVSITTKAKQKRGTNADPVYEYIWEYFAMPMTEITTETKPTNNGSSATLFAEQSQFITGVYTWGGNDWTAISSWTDVVPFKGYQLTNNSADGGVTYTFKGHLIGIDNGEYKFTSKGYGYFGNSYTAPIVISNFLSALDNAVYERTVWLYDAGADTYVSVNPLAARLGSAKYKDGTAIKEIRSLQAFILNKKKTGEGTATVNYRDAIWNNPRINSLVATANPAPARHEADEMLWTNIYVSANGNKEMVTLIEDAEFTSAFENGADAGKYINANSMNLYAATNDGEQAIVATDNLENTLISFQAGNATEYTLSFENGNEDYMLRDNVTGMTVAMEEGAVYTFEQAANTTVPARFEVIAAPKTATAIENVEEAAKATGIYTITGQYMGRDFTNLPAGVYVVNGVKIVK